MISAIAGSLRGGGETPGKAIKAQHAVQIQVSLDLLDSEAPSTRIQTVAWDPTQKMDELVKELVTAVFELEDTDPGQYCLQQVETGEWIYVRGIPLEVNSVTQLMYSSTNSQTSKGESL